MSSARLPIRDVIGYGRVRPAGEWPSGAKLAVSLVLNYEEGSERWLPEDGENENLGELARSVDPQYRDLTVESVYEYGSRAGVHRILRLFEHFEVPCTVFAAAQALERNPEVCASIRTQGHEVCAHGFRWREAWRLSRDEEAVEIRRAVASIERTCGMRPVGWYDRYMPSIHNRELLVEEGGFMYDSNAYNDDVPYYVQVLQKPHLVIPYTLTYNDVRFVSGGLGGSSDFVDLLVRALDYLLNEGEDRPCMMSIGVHARWSGQAGRTSALREFIDHARRKPGVWFARRRDIAQAWIHSYPPGTRS